jgi:hypothetical protein
MMYTTLSHSKYDMKFFPGLGEDRTVLILSFLRRAQTG